MMKCEICDKGPAQGITLYRQNEKGVKGEWRCAEHSYVEPDPLVQEVVDALEKKEE